MKTKIVMITLTLLSMLILRCSGDNTAAEESGRSDAVYVKTVRLEPSSFYEYLEITGTVKARNQIKIIGEEGGLLKTVRKDKGSYARSGDTLAVLENRVLEASFKEAKAGLQQAELNHKSSKVLFSKKAISENEFLASQYTMDRARAAYDFARARYEKLFIVAPISGRVNDRYYDFGAYIMPMTPVFELIDNGKVKVEAGVAERFISDIGMNTPVTLTFDAYRDVSIRSRVSFVSRSIDPISRTFKIEIDLDNSDQKLAPEMIANLKLLRKAFKNKIVIPIDALLNTETGRTVFINDNNTAREVNIDVMAIHEDSVLVDGLLPDQELVVLGQQDLSDGAAIQAMNGEITE